MKSSALSNGVTETMPSARIMAYTFQGQNPVHQSQPRYSERNKYIVLITIGINDSSHPSQPRIRGGFYRLTLVEPQEDPDYRLNNKCKPTKESRHVRTILKSPKTSEDRV